MKNVVIVKNMSELGAGTRGSSLGFDAMEMAALKFGKNFLNRYPVIEVQTFNRELYGKVETPYAKFIDAIEKSALEAGKVISGVLEKNLFPFIVSGDHSNAASSIYAIRKQFPEKRLGVIWIDAHGDLHSPYTTPSGNMHGMPLAISLGEDNDDRKRNQIRKFTAEKWDHLKSLGGIKPKIRYEDLVFFAVRDTEADEDYLIQKHQIKNFGVDEIRYRGIQPCVADAMSLLKHCDILYLSFDVDAMDCNLVSEGTGTPVEFGLSPDEAQSIMEYIMEDERLICFEMVEINPLLDNKGNKMAETAVRILDNLIRKYLKK